MLTLPSTINSTNYRLLPAGKFYPERRNGNVLGVVLHITAGLQDLGMSGTDESAEGTIKWALSARPEVSWHAGADSDGVELCLPDSYTAWHAKGYNSRTVGIEISKLNVDWSTAPDAWVTATLKNAARYLAAIVKKHGLPLHLNTLSEVDAAVAANRKFGFVYHSTTSAGTRSDPGKNFPIERLFTYIRAELATVAVKPPVVAPKPTPVIPVYPGPSRPSRYYSGATKAFQRRLKARGWTIDVDGYHGPATTAVFKSFQKNKGLKVDGIGGPATWAALWRLPVT